ncbi:MAG: response regulator [Planctomycetota bacterium]|nr:response regulator [Planctomycetota bacterium]
MNQLTEGGALESVLASLAEQLTRCYPRGHVTIRIDGGVGAQPHVVHATSASKDVYSALHLAAPCVVDARDASLSACGAAVLRRDVTMPSAWAELRGAAECFDLRAVSVAPIVAGSNGAVGVVVISEAGDLVSPAESFEVAATGARLAGTVLRRAANTAGPRQRLLDGHVVGGGGASIDAGAGGAAGDAAGAARVLVVEDDAAVGSIMKRLLVRDGHEAKVVADPFEALDLIEAGEGEIDLCFFDYTMPGLDGLALARRLRGAGVDVPIVMISGMGEDHMRKVCGGDTVDAFVSKPFTPTGLRAAMGQAQQRRAAS